MGCCLCDHPKEARNRRSNFADTSACQPRSWRKTHWTRKVTQVRTGRDWLTRFEGIKKRDFDDEWTEEQKEFYFSYLTEKHKELGDGRDGKGVSYIEYLRDKRIELDTVVNVVGAQKFWEWFQDRILKTFKTRNYNRAITVPRYVPTPTMEEFQKRIKASNRIIHCEKI